MKKTKFRRFLALVLAVFMAWPMFGAPVLAAEDDESGGGGCCHDYAAPAPHDEDEGEGCCHDHAPPLEDQEEKEEKEEEEEYEDEDCEDCEDHYITITDVTPVLASISVLHQPARLAYNVGDALDLAGLVVTLQFEYDDDGDITVRDEVVAFEDFGDFGITTFPSHGTELQATNNSSGVLIFYSQEVNALTAPLTVAQTFTVTFDMAGGTRHGGGYYTQFIPTGGNAVLPAVTRSGHYLAGWAVLDGDYPDPVYHNITSDRTITAVWLEEFPVTFDLNGGERVGGGGLNQNIPYGRDALPPEVERDGHVLTGWSAPYTGITAPVTLTAEWRPVEVTSMTVHIQPNLVYLVGSRLDLTALVVRLETEIGTTDVGFDRFEAWGITTAPAHDTVLNASHAAAVTIMRAGAENAATAPLVIEDPPPTDCCDTPSIRAFEPAKTAPLFTVPAWTLCYCGTLTVQGGNLISTHTEESPWAAHRLYITAIVFAEPIRAATALANLFRDMNHVVRIEGLHRFDTTGVTDMSSMFHGASALAMVDVSGFDVSSVSDMSSMFQNTSALTLIDLSDWDTPFLTSTESMFSGSGVRYLDLSGLDTASRGTNTVNMFSATTHLRQLTLSQNFAPTPGTTGLPGRLVGQLWRNVGDGTVQHPRGEHLLDSAALIDTYRGGAATGINDTWVWREGTPENPWHNFITQIRVYQQPLLDYGNGDQLDLSDIIIRMYWSDGGPPLDVPFSEFAAHRLTAVPAHGTVLNNAAHHWQPVTITHTPVVPVPDHPYAPGGIVSTQTEVLAVGEAAYTVTFDLDGGTYLGDQGDLIQRVSGGSDAVPPLAANIQPPVGHFFYGWTVDGQDYPAPVYQDITSDRTIRAVWTQALVNNIEIIQEPNLIYSSGQTLNLTGLQLRLTYQGGTTRYVTFTTTADFSAYGLTAAPAHGTVLTMPHHNTPITISHTSPAAANAHTGPLQVAQTVFTVTFVLGGGVRTGGGFLIQQVAFGEDAIPPEVHRDFFTFMDWSAPTTDITADTRIYALWDEVLCCPPHPVIARGGGTATTPNWKICGHCNTLTVAGGTLTRSPASSPWLAYNDHITRIVFTDNITAGAAFRGIFRDLHRVTEIVGLDLIDTGGARDMTSMFNGASSLASIDISGWDTRGVASMAGFFTGTTSLRELRLGDNFMAASTGSLGLATPPFDDNYEGRWHSYDWPGAFTAVQLINLYRQAARPGLATWIWLPFTPPDCCENPVITERSPGTARIPAWLLCSACETLTVRGGNLTRSPASSPWFNYREGIARIAIVAPVTAVGSFRGIFRDLHRVAEIVGLELIDTSGATDMTSLFNGASSLASIDISSWDTRGVFGMNAMFLGTTELRELSLGDNFRAASVGGLGLPIPADGSIWRAEDRTAANSTALFNFYRGANVSAAGTWVWYLPIIREIAVTRDPARMSYIAGQALDLSGLIVQLTHTDDTTRNITFANFEANNLEVSVSHEALLTADQDGAHIIITHAPTGSYAQTVTALSVREHFIVTFNLAGGTYAGEGQVVRHVSYGGSAAPPSSGNIIPPEGKTFGGWRGVYTDVTDDLTITALWVYAPCCPGLPAVASGGGTAAMPSWVLCECGTLTVRGGNFTRSPASSPWVNYRDHITRIEFLAPVTAGGAFRAIFRDLHRVTEIVGLELIDTGGATDMTSMFNGASSLASIDISSWDTRGVHGMSGMFLGTAALRELRLGDNFRAANAGALGLANPADGNVWRAGDRTAANSAALLDLYRGANVSAAGTWVWYSPSIADIIITRDPTRLNYIARQALDLSGMIAQLTFTDGSTRNVAFANFEANNLAVSVSDGALLTAAHDNTRITVTHTPTGRNAQTINALSIREHLVVTFNLAGGTYAGEGQVVRHVSYGGSAAPPAPGNITPPTGRVFNGWQGVYTNVTSDLTVTALWTYAPCCPALPVIASGGGTAAMPSWTLCECGTLTVRGGNFTRSPASSPWFDYRESITRIEFIAPITAGSAFRAIFRDLHRVTEIVGLNLINTAAATDMTSMFNGASSLVSVDISGWDTRRVVGMTGFFTGAASLRELRLGDNFRAASSGALGLANPAAGHVWQAGERTAVNSTALLNLYRGAGVSAAGTWVWYSPSTAMIVME